jgi:hypothetical protein
MSFLENEKKMFKKKERKPEVGEHKFCPVCGIKLKLNDTFCLQCGYSFAARAEKDKKGVKWRNMVIVLILLLAGYIGLRYANGQPLIPTSFGDAMRTLFPPKK